MVCIEQFFLKIQFYAAKTWAGHVAPQRCGSTVGEGNTPLTFGLSKLMFILVSQSQTNYCSLIDH